MPTGSILSFPHRDWDVNDYHIVNTPMVRDPQGGTLFGLAAYRMAGKPLTVTEYDHPAPSEWAAEMVPMIFTTAAAQDLDGVFLFAYDHGAAGWAPQPHRRILRSSGPSRQKSIRSRGRRDVSRRSGGPAAAGFAPGPQSARSGIHGTASQGSFWRAVKDLRGFITSRSLAMQFVDNPAPTEPILKPWIGLVGSAAAVDRLRSACDLSSVA